MSGEQRMSATRVAGALGRPRPSLRRALRRARREEGVAMVEFALVLPILLVILAGIVKFGQAFNYYIDETHLASEGSRFASVNQNPGGSGTSLAQWLLNQADATDLQTNGQVTITCLDTNGD